VKLEALGCCSPRRPGEKDIARHMLETDIVCSFMSTAFPQSSSSVHECMISNSSVVDGEAETKCNTRRVHVIQPYPR
jgi:hypothetical protein